MAAPAVPYAAVLVGLFALGNAWVAVLGYHIGIVAVLTAARAWPLSRELLRGFNTLALLVLVPVFVSAGLAIYLVWPWAHLEGLELAPTLSAWGLDSGSLVFFGWYSLANPWLEELYWRGFLGSEQRRPVIADALFGGYHALVLVLIVEWPFAVLGGLVLAATGWIWRLVRRRYRGLLLPALTHLAADVSIVCAVFALH